MSLTTMWSKAVPGCTVAVLSGGLAAITGVNASAGELIGTLMNIEINHTGPFGEPVGGVYEYGSSQDYFDSANFSWNASSPAGFAGYDHSIRIDFSNFAYLDFEGEIGSFALSGIAIEVASDSMGIFASDGVFVGFNLLSGGHALSGNFSVNDVLNRGDGATLVVAWNSVPSPGALALLGLAGLIVFQRRRRAQA